MKDQSKEWNVRIQLGAWAGTVPITATTAKEAHRMALDAVKAIAADCEAEPVSFDVGGFNICADVAEGNLQVRVYPRDSNGNLWDDPIDRLDVYAEDVAKANAEDDQPEAAPAPKAPAHVFRAVSPEMIAEAAEACGYEVADIQGAYYVHSENYGRMYGVQDVAGKYFSIEGRESIFTDDFADFAAFLNSHK